MTRVIPFDGGEIIVQQEPLKGPDFTTQQRRRALAMGTIAYALLADCCDVLVTSGSTFPGPNRDTVMKLIKAALYRTGGDEEGGLNDLDVAEIDSYLASLKILPEHAASNCSLEHKRALIDHQVTKFLERLSERDQEKYDRAAKWSLT